MMRIGGKKGSLQAENAFWIQESHPGSTILANNKTWVGNEFKSLDAVFSEKFHLDQI